MTTPHVVVNPAIYLLMDSVVEEPRKEHESENCFTNLIEMLQEAGKQSTQVTWKKIFEDRKRQYSQVLTADYIDSLKDAIENFLSLEPSISEELKSKANELKDFIDNHKNDITSAPIELLPTELLLDIFEMLNPEKQEQNSDELNAMLTCMHFYTIITKIRNVRHLRISVENALGNLMKNIRPNTSFLKKIGKHIFLIAEEDVRIASKEMGRVLGRTLNSPYSFQNHIISTLVEAWLEQARATDDGKGKLRKKMITLLTELYHHPNCNKANQIHIASLTKKGGTLSDYKHEIQRLTSPLKDAVPEGIILAVEDSFRRQAVGDDMIPKLVISKDNTFKLNEVVAVNHEGNLIGKRSKLWYGVVREVCNGENDEKLYRVYTQLFKDSKGINSWIYDVQATPSELGKIPHTPSTTHTLGNIYKIVS